MKKFLSIVFVLCCYASFAQQGTFTPPRSSPSITVQDARFRPLYNFYLPHIRGFNAGNSFGLNNGLDTLGAVVYDDSSQHAYMRDTIIPGGGHKWVQLLRTGDATTVSNIGAGIRLYATQIPGLRTIFPVNMGGVAIDTVSNTNGATFQVDTSRLIHATTVSIRGRAPTYNTQQLYLDDPLANGTFYCDTTDHTTADDSSMTFVTNTGVRWKRLVTTPYLNAEWFGAVHNGVTNDQPALQKGINYIIAHGSAPRTLYLPQGTYPISSPLIIANFNGTTYGQATCNLMGVAAAKNDPSTVTTNINVNFENTFGIGIQRGKGCRISNITVNGLFSFPLSLSQVSVDTMTFAQWTDGVARQDRYSPYAGIVIDPFSDSTGYPLNSDMYPGLHSYCPHLMSTSGSTDITVSNCNINQFVVGFLLTAAFQQNGDIVNLADINFGANKVCYAITQSQSKDCHVDRFQCWSPAHTIFDCGNYGGGIGGGISPIVSGGNVAGAVKQLVNMTLGGFPGVFKDIYAESVYKIGYVFAPMGFSFNNCIVDFACSSNNMPYPDFFYLGQGVTFNNCMLRMYGQNTQRINLSGSNSYMVGGGTNAPPVMINLDFAQTYQVPYFKNVDMMYSSGVLGATVATNTTQNSWSVALGSTNYPKADPVYNGSSYEWTFNNTNAANEMVKVKFPGTYDRFVDFGNLTVFTNVSNWTGYIIIPSADTSYIQIGDFLGTPDVAAQDQFTSTTLPTQPIGFITGWTHGATNDTLNFTQLGQGIKNNTSYHVYGVYYVNSNIPIIGNLASGASIITKSQCAAGVLPGYGVRLDMPQFNTGTYVLKSSSDTIYMSTGNTTGNTFNDFTWTNGYPQVDIYSDKTPSQLIFNGAQIRYLIGGAKYHLQNSGGARLTQMGSTMTDEYLIQTTIYNADTSKHKLKYYPILSNTAGQNVPIGTTAQRFNSNYSPQGLIQINSDSTLNGHIHATIFTGQEWLQLANAEDASAGTLGYSQNATDNTISLGNTIHILPASDTKAGLMDTAARHTLDSVQQRLYVFHYLSGISPWGTTGDSAVLGGTLAQNTTITTAGNQFNIVGQISLNGLAVNSSLHSANYTALTTDNAIYMNPSGGTSDTVFLPATSNNDVFTIYNIGSGTVVVDGGSGNTIGATGQRYANVPNADDQLTVHGGSFATHYEILNRSFSTVFTETSSGITLGGTQGYRYAFNGGSPVTWTVPLLTYYKGTQPFIIKNAGSATVTVQVSGSDHIYTSSQVTSISVTAGNSAVLIPGTSNWYQQ